MRHGVRGLVLLLCLLAWVQPVCAGSTTLSPEPGVMLAPAGDADRELSLDLEAGYVGQADLTGGQGSVGVLRTTFTADYSIFRLSYGISRYLWEDGAEVRFATGDRVPWETLHDVTLQARLIDNSLGGDWRYWLNGELSSSFEQDFPGAVGAGFDGGVAYEFLDGWMIGLTGKGVILSALRDDLLGDLEMGLALAVSQKALRAMIKGVGLGGMLGDGSDRVGFSLALTGADKTYRLSPSSPVRRNGYLGIRRSRVGAYLDYRHDDRLTLSVGPEYTFSRKFSLYDSTGSLSSSHRVRDALGGSVHLRWDF